MRRIKLVLALATVMVAIMMSSVLPATAQMMGNQGGSGISCAPWTWDWYWSSSAQWWYWEWHRACSDSMGSWIQWDGWDWA
jgi:hypothetical protein